MRNKVEVDLRKLRKEGLSGLEPKIFLITAHCNHKIVEIENIVKKYDYKNEFYCWWNGESYDIGPKRINKRSGLVKLLERLDIKIDEVMTVGNGINDEDMMKMVGIGVSTDPEHLRADFEVSGEHLGGEVVVDRLLELKK